MRRPKIVGEASALLAAIGFIYWAAANTPAWALGVWIVFGVILIIDWMKGGILDKSIF